MVVFPCTTLTVSDLAKPHKQVVLQVLDRKHHVYVVNLLGGARRGTLWVRMPTGRTLGNLPQPTGENATLPSEVDEVGVAPAHSVA